MKNYPFAAIEKKWQEYWQDNKTFRVTEDPAIPREKRVYVLDMFPYPSSAGLHVGHPEGYTATDIYCRYLRMKGYQVLHPMGFDSFGLPAENYALKTRISDLMWNEKDGYYYDLDKSNKQIKVRTIASFWPLLAEIPNEYRAEALIAHLEDPREFGLDHPFPTLAASEKTFDNMGNGYHGSIFPNFTYIIIKGLEKYGKFELAREAALKHLYFILDGLHPEKGRKGIFWEAYAPKQEGPAVWQDNENFPRPGFLAYSAHSTISLMIENVVGLHISLPRKTVDWIIPTLELMGIEDLGLRRNMITILSNKSGRGWEIRLESEKLYYLTINILDSKKKTLPIPSGKCSILIDKI
ncbi:hypothetical protein ES705_36965 [subsurface metagenome]